MDRAALWRSCVEEPSNRGHEMKTTVPFCAGGTLPAASMLKHWSSARRSSAGPSSEIAFLLLLLLERTPRLDSRHGDQVGREALEDGVDRTRNRRRHRG